MADFETYNISLASFNPMAAKYYEETLAEKKTDQALADQVVHKIARQFLCQVDIHEAGVCLQKEFRMAP